MKKGFLFFVFLTPYIATFASEKNKHLYEMLHSPVRRAELVRSLEHPHWRGTFVEEAPHTPERLGKFLTRKAKNGLRFLQKATNNQTFGRDCADLKNMLPAGESPLKTHSFKESPSRVLVKTLNFAMATHQLRHNAARGDITEKALIMRKKAGENPLYVKGRKLSDIFAKMDNEEAESDSQQQNASSSASQSSNPQPSAAFAPNNVPAAPSLLASPIAQPANNGSSSSPILARDVAAKSSSPLAILKRSNPAKKKQIRRSNRGITLEKMKKEREKKKKEFAKASAGTQKLAFSFGKAQ